MRDFASAGVWEAIRHHLVLMLREREGREPSPSAGPKEALCEAAEIASGPDAPAHLCS
jgi:hypothetical protein